MAARGSSSEKELKSGVINSTVSYEINIERINFQSSSKYQETGFF
jgi:hypothetical protein